MCLFYQNTKTPQVCSSLTSHPMRTGRDLPECVHSWKWFEISAQCHYAVNKCPRNKLNTQVKNLKLTVQKWAFERALNCLLQCTGYMSACMNINIDVNIFDSALELSNLSENAHQICDGSEPLNVTEGKSCENSPVVFKRNKNTWT